MLSSQLPQCPGAFQCPLKIDHPPNGEEFVLSCQLCQEKHDRDPEVTRRIERFEAQQRFKRTVVAIFSGFLHFLNWFVLLASLGHSAYTTDLDIKLLIFSALWGFLKVIPLFVMVIVFAYQSYRVLFPHNRRGLALKKRMLIPYLLIASWMYFVGTFSLSLFLLVKGILFLLFALRVIMEICIYSSLFFSNQLKTVVKLCIVIAIIEGIRLLGELPMNSWTTVGQISVGIFLLVNVVASFMSTRKRVMLPLYAVTP